MSNEPWNGGILGDVGRDIDNIRLRSDMDGLAQGLANAHAELQNAGQTIHQLRSQNETLAHREIDFKVAILDVARSINNPVLNAALKADIMRTQANSSKIKMMEGVLCLERRSRWVLEEVIGLLAQKYGIPSTEKDELIKKCYEKSMQELPEKKIPIGIKLDREGDFLFLDETVKRLNLEGDEWFEHIDAADAAEREFLELEAIRKRREDEKEARRKPYEAREAN